jgi:two-component system nitrate/nitrite response regulator NarL
MSADPAELQIRVVIADDHSIFREGLCRVLEAERSFTVVGQAATEEQALELAGYLRPDILLLGFSMSGQTSSEILRQLPNIAPSVRTILLIDSLERPVVLNALLLGARGVVAKISASIVLFKSIRAVMAGEIWVSRNTVVDLIEMLRARSQAGKGPSRSFDLTRRELEVIAAVVEGHFNKEIAQDFRISEDTVKHHLTRIFDKLGVSNRVELAMFASHHNLVKAGTRFRPKESLRDWQQK